MDYLNARADLAEYVSKVEACHRLPPWSKERRAALKGLNIHALRVNRILASLTPDHGSITGTVLACHRDALPLVHRIWSFMIRFSQMDNEKDSQGYPTLPMTLLDPLVNMPAQPQWAAGHYRSAVADAAANVSQYTQWRLSRYDIGEKDLMAQAFTPEPPKDGKPRLRCPGNQKKPSVKSQQEGAMYFAQGCYAALRNPANHLTGDWNPVTAFHHLTAFSIVADWVQNWDVVKAPPPPPVPKQQVVLVGGKPFALLGTGTVATANMRDASKPG